MRWECRQDVGNWAGVQARTGHRLRGAESCGSLAGVPTGMRERDLQMSMELWHEFVQHPHCAHAYVRARCSDAAFNARPPVPKAFA